MINNLNNNDYESKLKKMVAGIRRIDFTGRNLSGADNDKNRTVRGHQAFGHFKSTLAGKGFTNKAVQMMVVDFPPLSRSPSHRHPCPTFGYVISGQIVSVFEGQTYHYKAGESFYETPNGLHSDARNDSKTETAKLLVIYVKDADKPAMVMAGH
jgi:quercetin dioxygenase-like cupin family protein